MSQDETAFSDPEIRAKANEIAEYAIQKMIDQAERDDIVIMRKNVEPVVVLMKYSLYEEYKQAREDLARITDGGRRAGEQQK